MKWQWRCLYFFLTGLVITSCQAAGVSLQTTPPGDINANIQSPSQTPTQMSVPEMTGTALAVPTVVYPTVSPPTVEELLQWSPYKTNSPDGNYTVVCGYSPPTLIYTPTKFIISTSDIPLDCDSNHMAWSSDSSFGFYPSQDQFVYRWRVDGSQPEAISINILPNPPGVDCGGKIAWSPDEKYLAIFKACGLYVIELNDESSFHSPILIEQCGGCFEDFRWVTRRLLLVKYFKSVSLVHIPSGNAIAGIWTSGGLCAEQIPLFSPDGRWIVSDAPWCGGGGQGPDQSVISNLEDGSRRVFSESFADRIDFIGWSQDSSKLYLISRPTEIDALPDPRTPFGLLAMNPETLQVQNLFEQAWFVSFNKDFSWAYIAFPVKNDDGSFRLDGGLWKVGTSQLIGKQIMADSLNEHFLAPVPYFTVQPFYSATGEELGSSSTGAGRLVPAVWSHDHLSVATINTDHQLVAIDVQGDVRPITQLDDNQEWFNSDIKWSDDDQTISVNDATWIVP